MRTCTGKSAERLKNHINTCQKQDIKEDQVEDMDNEILKDPNITLKKRRIQSDLDGFAIF